MQRLLDIAQFCVYLAGIAVLLWGGHLVASNQLRLGREMEVNALRHDQLMQQMIRDHNQQLEDHRRLMQR
jgi:hypothetical protein